MMGMLSIMAAAPVLLLMHITLWLPVHSRLALPKVNLTIPVNPVREDSVLSIHCRISNLNRDIHTVKMSRLFDDGKEELLTINEEHFHERVFNAAPRKFPEEITVYLVTLVNVKRNERGTYTCSVYESQYDNSDKGPYFDGDSLVAEESAFVEVEYFPSGEYPQCQSNVSGFYTIRAGTGLSLTCKTEKGQPPVSIKWSRVNGHLKTTDVISEFSNANGLITSRLVTTMTIEDHRADFVCTISSPIYDGRVYTCDVGPFRVLGPSGRPPIKFTQKQIPYVTDSSGMSSKHGLRNLTQAEMDLSNNFLNNGLHNDVRFHTWSVVVAATICIVVLTIGLTFIIVFYGLGYSKRARVVDYTPQLRHHRQGDVRVEFRRSAEPNIYVAV